MIDEPNETADIGLEPANAKPVLTPLDKSMLRLGCAAMSLLFLFFFVVLNFLGGFVEGMG